MCCRSSAGGWGTAPSRRDKQESTNAREEKKFGAWLGGFHNRQASQRDSRTVRSTSGVRRTALQKRATVVVNIVIIGAVTERNAPRAAVCRQLHVHFWQLLFMKYLPECGSHCHSWL